MGIDRFRVVTYNVENLFDLRKSGNEYRDYQPFAKSKWNNTTLRIKTQNLAKVIKDIDGDIIALQEVESLHALKILNQRLKYPYYAIAKASYSPVKVALLSRFPIKNTRSILVNPKFRHIFKATVMIKDNPLTLYINHWPSKRHREQKRIPYANRLKKELLHHKLPFLVLGDLNSHYNERQLINKKTGINEVLSTTIRQKNQYQFTTLDLLRDSSSFMLYNLWLELPKKRRYNYQYKRKNYTMDHILIGKALIDNKGIEYIPNSFGVFIPDYLLRSKGRIYRWQQRGKNRTHIGKGFSDHLPIYADFKLF